MKKFIPLSIFVLSVSLACFVTEVVTPPPFVPTYDDNLISTMVIQTAEMLALSFTPTNTNLPTDTPSVTPSFTAVFTGTNTDTPSPTHSLTYTATQTLPPTATFAQIPIITVTNTSASATKTSIPPTATKIPSTNTPISPAATNTSIPASATKIPSATNTKIPPAATATSAPSATPNPPTSTPVSICPETNASFTAQVILLINAERAKVGLPALNYQAQLGAAAQLHSEDMACNNYFSHTGLDGSSFSERAQRQGYTISYGAENIAAGYSAPKDVVQGWMNSPGHKANILGENYVDVGVGYAYSKNSSYGAYWTAVFGSQ